MLGIVLLVFVVLLLFGGFMPFGAGPGPMPGTPVQAGPLYHGYGYGWGGGGVLGTILVIVLILVLLGHI